MSRWHPREHAKALRAMQCLTLEERGAYNTCLDLIYDREGPIPDDPRWLAGWMGVSVRKWAAIRASLIAQGKLFEVSFNSVPSLMNERAAIELQNQSERARKLSESGAKGGEKTAETKAKANKNNGETQAPAAPSLKLITVTDTETDIAADEGADERANSWPDLNALDGVALDALERALREAAGLALNAASPKLCVIAPILGLARAGAGPPCDLEADVLPAIRACAARARKGSVANWEYFVPAIREARDSRLSGAPPTDPSRAHERSHDDPKLINRQANNARSFAGAAEAARQRWKP